MFPIKKKIDRKQGKFDAAGRNHKRKTYKKNGGQLAAEKDAAHYVSWEIVNYIQNHIPGPVPDNRLHKATGLPQKNLKMVKRSTNRIDHCALDKDLMKLWDTYFIAKRKNKTAIMPKLSTDAIKRAKYQIEQIQKRKYRKFGLAFEVKARELFQFLGLWDDTNNSSKLNKTLVIRYISKQSKINFNNKNKIVDIIKKADVDFNTIYNVKSKGELKQLLNITNVKAKLLFREIKTYQNNINEEDIQHRETQKRAELQEQKMKIERRKQEKDASQQQNEQKTNEQMKNSKSKAMDKRMNDLNNVIQKNNTIKEQQRIQRYKKVQQIQKQQQVNNLKQLNAELETLHKQNIRKINNTKKMLESEKNKVLVEHNKKYNNNHYQKRTPQPTNTYRPTTSHNSHYRPNQYSPNSNHYHPNQYRPPNYGYDFYPPNLPNTYGGGSGGGGSGGGGNYTIGVDQVVGTLISNGSRNGGSVYVGTRGRNYTLTGSGNRNYNVQTNKIDYK